MKNKIEKLLKKSLIKIYNENIEIEILKPQNKENGDYSTNLAMKLVKILKENPIDIANKIVSSLPKNDIINEVKIVKPGFINFYINEEYFIQNINNVLRLKDEYGKSNVGKSKKVNIEFVSVNPTGTMHLGHARNAFYGASLANIMKFAGYNVTKEYYVNDAGNQINNLKYSVISRYKQLCKIDVSVPDNGYHGSEIITVAESLFEKYKDSLDEAKDEEIFKDYSVNFLLNGIKSDLEKVDVNFDVWTSEKDLYKNNEVSNVYDKLNSLGFIYKNEDALYLKTSEFFDDKDRVIVKTDGNNTYLLPDIAYHYNKYNRGFDIMIDVLGADHNGYIARLKSSMEMLNCDSKKLEIKILQLVKVMKNNEEIKMSKRSGNSITLNDLIEMIGSDAAKYFMVSKSLDTQMELDLELINKKSSENPLFYIEYAYARIMSILNGKIVNPVEKYETLISEEAIEITKKIIEFEEIVQSAALKREVHIITNYLYSLAGLFHSYYNSEKIITEDELYTNERLNFLLSISIVLKNGLGLLEINPRDVM